MADETPVTGMSRGMRWLLIVSLALNLAVLGMIGSWWLTWGPHHRHQMPRMEQVGGPLTRALVHEDRRAIGRALRAAYRQEGDTRGVQRARFDEMIAALRAEPFDAEAVAAQMAAQRATLQERLNLGQTLLLERLSAMEPEARAAYAERLEAELRRHRRR